MESITLTIDGREVIAPAGATILEAARSAEIYIPSLCNHPDLPLMKGMHPQEAVFRGGLKIENQADVSREAEGCGLCVVEIKGQEEPVPSCATPAQPGMKVVVDSDRLQKIRREKLAPFLADHPHACLTCAQAEGCSRSQCSSNVPENERCCELFGNCEFQKLVEYVGVLPLVGRWIPPGLPVIDDQPLFKRDYNLCLNCTRCVRVCREVRGVEALGFVFDEKGGVVVGTVGPTLAESGCKFCTACVEVCPTGAIMDKGIRPGKQEEDLVPCKSSCPAGVDIPGYVRAVKSGRTDQALALIREKAPFPGVLGRVCVHPCEDNCRRGEIDEPVSICALKRYAADQGSEFWKSKLTPVPATGKSVAVVGSGPAGMSAAFYLARIGHRVIVFEQADQAGGMLCYGIPSYRLPRGIVEAEIRDILELGVELKISTPAQADELKSFDACFLGLGAQLSRKLDIPGSDNKGVLWGVDFLKAVRTGEPPDPGSKVIVVGGGNVALDVALTAKRLGALEVTLVCLESREEMPAHNWEIAQAEAEGIRIENHWGPQKVFSKKEGSLWMTFTACTSVFDRKGNFAPCYDDCKLKDLEAMTVILAVGQAVDLSLARELGLETERGLIKTDPATLAASRPGFFVGGDAALAPGTVIQAIAHGRKAAAEIDRYLGGKGDVSLCLADPDEPDPFLGREDGFAEKARQAEPSLALEERFGFEEVFLCFHPDEAQAEASRCLQCDLRLKLNQPPSPPEKLLPFEQKQVAQAPEDEGAFILYDEEKQIMVIQGVDNMRAALLKKLEGGSKAVYFECREDKMFSKAESELVQAYLQHHGKMPPGDGGDGGGDDLDDLF